MSVYMTNLSGNEEKLDAIAIGKRFLEKAGPPVKPDNRLPYIAKFLNLQKPDQQLLNDWNRAVRHFANVEEPKFLLDFRVAFNFDVEYKKLFLQIASTYPTPGPLKNAVADILQAEQLAAQERELAREQARSVYNQIYSATVYDKTYGAKLKSLIDGGWAKLGPPDTGDAYMSLKEKQAYGKQAGNGAIFQASFGVSRPIIGTLPDEYAQSDRLALHEHCTYTGKISAASIQKEEEAGLNGITKRWLESTSYAYFESAEITRKKLFS
jgi:hypothetical protein